MEIRTSTIAVVAASCITVGAAGAFLASRPSRAPQQSASAADTAGVEQSEAVITDAPAVQSTDAASEHPAAVTPPPVTTPRTPAPALTTRATRPAPAAAAKPAPVAAAPPVTQQARASVPEPARTVTAPAPTVPAAAAARPEPREPKEPAPPVERTEPIAPKVPAGPRFVDLVVATDSVLGLQIETPVTSEKARVEDEVVARVTRDVRVGDRVAIPAGSQARGEVTMVERGGKVKDRARLGIRFTSVVLADGTRVPLETDTIYREGDSPTGESTAKIGGGAIGGAILGGIFGGAKGAAIGAATGAGAGTAAVVAGGRNAATLPAGTPVTVRVVKPATVTVEE
jgi:type IV secretory pathway VirB10-like protein